MGIDVKRDQRFLAISSGSQKTALERLAKAKRSSAAVVQRVNWHKVQQRGLLLLTDHIAPALAGQNTMEVNQ
jgi:hypothetical protein